ncbi:MAG: glycosyltransferase family 2 protein [Deltaproteobacteria bacterium]|nr:glycosyltransferase family 2 protein [Deltaproteobacteria bacterium]
MSNRSSNQAPVDVGVVVVHYGDQESTFRCVHAVVMDSSSASRQVVVVDNSGNLEAGSLPGTTIHLSSADNPGFGEGANRGVRRLFEEVSPKHLLLLNHDVEILPGYLDSVLLALATPGVGAAGGPLFLDRRDGPLWYAGGGVNYLTGTVWQSRSPKEACRRRQVSFLPGAAIAITPAAWEEVRGFDPRFFLYNEDLDLCRRLRRAGWQLGFEPRLSAIHYLGAATGSREISALYLEHLSATRFLPFRSLLYRAYLGLAHSAYVSYRALFLAARLGLAGKSRVRALLRGHRRALCTIFRTP